MSIPYRRWLQFNTSTLEAYHYGTKVTKADWTIKYLDTGRIGLDRIDTPAQGKYYEWHSIFRPKANLGFESLNGMDQIVSVKFLTEVVNQVNTDGHILTFNVVQGIMNNDNAWAHRWVNGKFYDGTNNWDSYPPGQHAGYNNQTINTKVIGVGYPWLLSNLISYMYSYKTGGGNGVEANRYQDDFFKGGAHFKADTLLPSIPNLGQALRIGVIPIYINVKYFNPVVNKLSRYWVPTIGGVEVILTGLGFNNDDDELDGEGDSKPGGWNDLVDTIEFWKQSYAKRYYYKDDFNAAVIGDEWATDKVDADKTIVQLDGVLTMGLAVNTDARWISGLNKAPKLYQDVPDTDTFDVIIKINNFTLNNYMNVGLYIGYHDAIQGGREACRFMLRRYDGAGNSLQVLTSNSGNSNWQGPGSGDLPIWLKIKVDAGVISFWYRYAANDWVQMYHEAIPTPWNLSGVFESGMEIGVHVDSDSATLHGGIQAPIEYFEVSSGSPYVTLSRADGDFTVDSNTQITIPADKFPALEAGNYILRLIKEDMDFSPRNSSVDVWSWAGDWRCDLDGLVSEGVRLSILADDTPPKEARERGGSIILMDIEKKAITDGAISKEYYSQDIVRAPDMVYEGIIQEVSSFRRAVDDRTGLFKVADCSVTLSNQNKKFSKLLATHFFKDQLATFYHAFIEEEESKKREIVRMVVEDYNIKGGKFELILKDVTQKYLNKQLPRNICTNTELDEDDPDVRKFPYIHDSFEGDPMPEILGLATYTGEDKRGAVEAIYVNTVSYKYLAAAGFLKEITEVYSDNTLQILGTHYNIVQDDKYTYIDFTGDQGDNRITFNCKGYPYHDDWNSDNDYVQNPAYIIGYVLMELLGVPEKLIDIPSITTLAAKYEAMGEAESGCLIIQSKRTATQVLKDLLFSCGAKLWISKMGEFKVGRKDETSLATTLIVFEQFDLLDAPNKKMGLKKVVTGAKVYWGFIPVHDVFKGSKEVNRKDLEDDYGGEHEDTIRPRPLPPWKDRRR